jgi:hypothetical protein
MEIISRMIKGFSLPLLLMNGVSGIASGLWLLFIGRWVEIALGIVLLTAGGFGLGFAMLPGLVFDAPANYFQGKGSRSGMLIFGFLSLAYTMLVVTIWCSTILFIFGHRLNSVVSHAQLIWSYSVAIGPLYFLAQKDASNEYSILTTFFAQVAYLLAITVMIVVGVSISSLLIAFVLIGAVMLCATIVQFRIATVQIS